MAKILNSASKLELERLGRVRVKKEPSPKEQKLEV